VMGCRTGPPADVAWQPDARASKKYTAIQSSQLSNHPS
jgi:hypothetical protein